MNLEQKIERAFKIIEYSYKEFKNPVLLTSFGKDSMVVLDLLIKSGIKPDCIFFKENIKPKKYKFANEIIEQLDLNVLSYLPTLTYWQESSDKNDFEVQCYYSHGEKDFTTCPVGLREYKDENDFVCCLEDIYNKPTTNGIIETKYDCHILGHRGDDKDPLIGSANCQVEMLTRNTKVTATYPIVHFTEQDIWDYIEMFNVPFNKERYEKIEGTYRQKEDLTYNPDYFDACFKCMRSDGEKFITCPKSGLKIMNIHHTLRVIEPQQFDYCK